MPLHPKDGYAQSSKPQSNIITTAKQKIYPINAANLRKAHAMLERGDTIGKIVLTDWG